MRPWGWILVLAGAALILWGLFYDTAYYSTDINNLGLIGNRIVIIILGCAGFVGGLSLIGFAALKNAIRPPEPKFDPVDAALAARREAQSTEP